ncbi:hypothetical protein SINU_06775 [Sporolactobacillus inulinus CASD]|uniref:Uncharacterized protein n=1 Tax=Sporolactobacillus inulinus CASD TaxID=1069536 RepID=A0A0U1QPM2_9BACL|nr:hypothetical protein SINU_06775 [Sporolactobacillus inulinus CASD]
MDGYQKNKIKDAIFKIDDCPNSVCIEYMAFQKTSVLNGMATLWRRHLSLNSAAFAGGRFVLNYLKTRSLPPLFMPKSGSVQFFL